VVPAPALGPCRWRPEAGADSGAGVSGDVDARARRSSAAALPWGRDAGAACGGDEMRGRRWRCGGGETGGAGACG